MRKKLGEILVESGAASGADVDEALRDQNAGEPNRLGDLLVAHGRISSQQLARALAQQYQLPYVDLPALPQAVLDLVPLELQRQYRFVPLESKDTELSIAMADLANIEVVALLEQSWTRVHVHVAAGDEIDALHATLSGLFTPPAPSAAPVASLNDDLFGVFELDAPTQDAPSPVPAIAPIAPVAPVAHPRPSPAASPRAEDLFGDLNLESARTGIPTRPPEEPSPVIAAEPEEPAPVISEVSGVVVAEPAEVSGVIVAEPAEVSGVIVAEPAEVSGVIVAEPAEVSGVVIAPSEVSGVVAVPESPGSFIATREGTGPLLDMLAEGGTGPVVDTPFSRDVSVGALVPSQPLQFTSPSGLAIPPPAAVSGNGSAGATAPSSPGEPLPDWLKGIDASAPPPPAGTPRAWTGALDHLAPSKLVVGLTRALLARGLVTEEEILAALGQKK